MLRTFKKLVFITSLVMTSATFAVTAPQNSQPINSIVAIVNNTPIMQSQVDALMKMAPPGQQPTEQMTLQALINQTVQMSLAAKAGITTSDKEVDAAIQRIAAQNKMTVAQMEAKVVQSGMVLASYKKQIKQQITMNKVQQEAVSGKVNVSDAEVEAFIKEHADELGLQTKYQYSDMLIPTSGQVSNAQATSYAKTLINQWKPGIKLATLASKLPASANASMAMTDQSQTPDDIPDVFLASLNKMKPGALSQPIVTGNGVHILQLDKKQVASYALQKQRAMQILSQQAFMKAVKDWVTKMKKSAYIKIMAPADNASA